MNTNNNTKKINNFTFEEKRNMAKALKAEVGKSQRELAKKYKISTGPVNNLLNVDCEEPIDYALLKREKNIYFRKTKKLIR